MDTANSIYGVNLKGHITPVMVRDAIIECYYRADSEVLEYLFQISNFASIQEKEDAKIKHVRVMSDLLP